MLRLLRRWVRNDSKSVLWISKEALEIWWNDNSKIDYLCGFEHGAGFMVSSAFLLFGLDEYQK